ncbi:MAG: DinB family protein [Bacteroidia bacterium]
MRPPKGTYPEYYENYIPLVKQENIKEALLENERETLGFFGAIPDNMGDHSYAAGKWTIKAVLNHIIDTERIFSYRALRFARKDDAQPLPYEQDLYVANAELYKRSLADLVLEFKTVRQATLSLFNSFSKEALILIGQTAAGKASVNAIGFTICGHSIHHINIVRERYLKNNFAV